MTVTRFPRAPGASRPIPDQSFLVDMRTGSVVAAGRLAGTLFGIDEALQKPFVLDAAMPAYGRLRTFARSGLTASPQLETLVLWGRSGRFTAHCRLTRRPSKMVTADLQETDAKEDLIQVDIDNIHDLLAETAATLQRRVAFEHDEATRTDPNGDRALGRKHSPGAHVAIRDAVASPALICSLYPPPAAARDDRATLQLIAHRIEQGVKLHTGSGVLPALDLADASERVPPAAPTAPEPEPSAQQQETGIAAIESALAPIAMEAPNSIKANENLAAAAGHDEAGSTLADTPAATGRAALALILAQAAHDIKTPLSAISAASEIIRDERLGPAGNERYRDYAADIHASARHALAIVDRLLRMPHAAGGEDAPETSPPEAALKPAPVDLNELVARCVAEITPLTDGLELNVILRLDPAAPHVEADAVGLKQSLLNILTNAMKFTAPGGALYVETERLGEKGVAVRVRDPGPGMTKGAVARLLTDRAGPASDKKPAIRPGLGLPQVRAFCRANNAELSIDSILKRGTTVAILLTR